MCPRYGEMVMEGYPYCSHCGVAFKWEEISDDDYNPHRERYMAKKRIEKHIDNGQAIMIIAVCSEFDFEDFQKIIRQHYV